MSEALQITLPGKRIGVALAILGFLCVPGQASAANVVSAGKLSGKILGLVTDAGGVPQMGAAVLLLNQLDKPCERALTDDKGAFSFDGLAAGVYSIRVSLAAFSSVSRSRIFVQPGLRTLLNVSLAGMFSSIQLVNPTPQQRAIMNDDWKWVLRTSNATRPVLRLLPGWKIDDHGPEHRAASGIFSDTRALVNVSAGDGGRLTSFGNEAGLGTSFSLATSVFGKNQIQFSGNVAYASQTGMPSTGFRTSYSHGEGDDATPEITVTMRQMYVPGRVGVGESSMPMLRTLSLSAKDATQLSDSLRLEYGFALDTMSFIDRLNNFSPYGRLIYSLSENEQVEFSYTSGVPRADMYTGASSSGQELQDHIRALSLFPRISIRDSRLKVQQARNYEIGYRRLAGSRSYKVAVYREETSNATMMISGGDGLLSSGEVLPDLFTSSSVFNAGDYQSLGFMASVTQNLGENLKVSLMYGSGDALLPGRPETAGQSPDDLRALIHRGRRSAVTTQVSGSIPGASTQYSASYQWTDTNSVTPSHFFATQRMGAEAGLNIFIRQPIRSFSLVPVRLEATADLRNLLAEGYLPFAFSDGRQVVLMHTPRSFRGGLSFIF